MRKYFFLSVMFFIVIAFVVAGAYLFGRALYTVYSDWRLNKELDELQREMATRRAQRKAEGRDEEGELV
jgi:flagellar biogenesis protein FliO